MQSSRRSEGDWQGLVSEVRAAAEAGGFFTEAPPSIWKERRCSGRLFKTENSRFFVSSYSNHSLTVYTSLNTYGAITSIRLAHLLASITSEGRAR